MRCIHKRAKIIIGPKYSTRVNSNGQVTPNRSRVILRFCSRAKCRYRLVLYPRYKPAAYGTVESSRALRISNTSNERPSVGGSSRTYRYTYMYHNITGVSTEVRTDRQTYIIIDRRTRVCLYIMHFMTCTYYNIETYHTHAHDASPARTARKPGLRGHYVIISI